MISCLLLLASVALAAEAPTAKTINGTYQGLANDNFGQDMFLGVPYCQPPSGDLRLRPPQPLNTTWNDTRMAVQYGDVCASGEFTNNMGLPTSDNCLTLNVIRPYNVTAPLPVGVWIFGGGYQDGSSRVDLNNLTYIVQNSAEIGHPMLGVSINYRISGFGFLSSQETFNSGNTNLGLRDQRLALQWIQENIAAFGGDPSKVTIWGQSAGAMSVSAHLLAYNGRDDKLFSQAICESGAPTTEAFYAATGAANQAVYDNITAFVNCSDALDSLACLRTVPFDTLRYAFNISNGLAPPTYEFLPVIDNDFIQGYPSDQLASGAFVKVPLLHGNCKDEGMAFAIEPVTSDTDIIEFLQLEYDLTNSSIQTLLQLYPNNQSIETPFSTQGQAIQSQNITYPSAFGPMFRRAATIIGDMFFIAQRRLHSQVWAKAGLPVYAYQWEVPTANTLPYQGVMHSSEMVYVFDNTAPKFNQSEYQPMLNSTLAPVLAKTASTMWVAFITTGDPNNHGLANVTQWDTYGSDKNIVYFDLTGPVLGTDDFRTPQFDFIQSIPKQLLH